MKKRSKGCAPGSDKDDAMPTQKGGKAPPFGKGGKTPPPAAKGGGKKAPPFMKGGK